MTTTTKKQRKKRRRRFGSVFKRPGGRGWLARYRDPTRTKTAGGRVAYVTRSVQSRAEGERLLREVEKALLVGAPAPRDAPKCELTLLQAIDEYIDSKRAEGRAESGLRRYQVSRRAVSLSPIAGVKVGDLSARDIEGYAAWRRVRRWRGVRTPGSKRTDANAVIEVKGEPVSNSTVNRDTALISAALGRLIRLDLLDKNPVARTKRGKEPKKARAILSKDECAKFLRCCDPHMRILALAMLTCGGRPSELRAVTWGDISFGNKTITLYRSKVSVGDALPMHPTLAEELKALKKRCRAAADDDHVFLSSKGRAYWDHRWAWKKALKKAGLHRRKGLTLYSLRHSFATNFLEHGSPSDLQQILGHSSYTTTERYVRAVSKRARVGIEALEF